MRNSLILIFLHTLFHNVQCKVSCGTSYGNINTPDCSNYSQHIVNGLNANQRAWPWQLVLFYNGFLHCGATLIHPKFAITAAHCTDGYYRDQFKVYGGLSKISDIENKYPYWWESTIEAYYQHHGYDGRNQDGDISILKLETEVPSSELLYPACLPQDREVAIEGEGCYVTGWGHNQEGGHYMDEMQEVCVPILSWDDCSRHYEGIQSLTRNMICAGYFDGRKDACQVSVDYDSGGPLVCKRDDIWKLFGIVSWGNGCARKNNPGVYTNVLNYLKWIREHVIDVE